MWVYLHFQSVVCPISSSSAQQQGLEENEDESLSVEGSAHEKLDPEPAIGIDIKGLKKKFKVCKLWCCYMSMLQSF